MKVYKYKAKQNIFNAIFLQKKCPNTSIRLQFGCYNFSKTVISPKIYIKCFLLQWFLLTQAMKTTKSPHNIRRVNPYNSPVGKTCGQNLYGSVVLRASKSWHNHRFVGDVKVSI